MKNFFANKSHPDEILNITKQKTENVKNISKRAFIIAGIELETYKKTRTDKIKIILIVGPFIILIFVIVVKIIWPEIQ